MEKLNTLQRIKIYIDYKGLTNKDFEISVGFSNGAFASQLKNNRTIGVDKLENILSAYPEINPEWLLTGKGEMLKSDGPAPDRQKEIDRLLELLDQKDLEIKRLKKDLKDNDVGFVAKPKLKQEK